MPSKCPQQFRDRVMRMVADRLEDEEEVSRYQAI